MWLGSGLYTHSRDGVPLGGVLAKARHHKKPYQGMSTEEYRAALDKLGLSIVGSAECLGLSRRQSQRYASGATPIADPVAKLLRLAIRIGLTANDLKDI